VQLSDFNAILYKYLSDNGFDLSEKSMDKVYSRGNAFDMGLIENIYNSYDWQHLFRFWNYADVRTEINAIAPYIDPDHDGRGYVRGFEIEGMIKHNSVHDIVRDIMQLQFVHYKLNERLTLGEEKWQIQMKK